MVYSDQNRSSTSVTIFCTAVAAVVVGGVVAFACKKNRDKANKANESNSTISYNLDKMESLFYLLDIPPITTLTWFEGDYQLAKPKLEERMKQLISKNPWLQGKIEVTSYIYCSCKLTYTKHDDEISITNKLTVLKSSPISRDMPISDQNLTLLKSHVYKNKVFIKNGQTEPFFKATLIPCATNPEKRFALVVQLSHVVGDGATYYNLMHQLCSTEDNFVELIPQRVENSSELQIAAMGKAEAGYMTSLGFNFQNLLGIAMNVLKGPMPFDYKFLDSSKIEQAKLSSAKEAGLSFISTNDVLTSWLMTNSTSDFGMMAINWRGRLEGHASLLAGNYENLLYYDKTDSASPDLIRRSLKSYKRVVTANYFPPWYKVASSTCSTITNWMTFAKPNEIEGCKEDVHFPLILPDLVPCHRFRMFIIFRSRPGMIGLCFPPGAMKSGGIDSFVTQ